MVWDTEIPWEGDILPRGTFEVGLFVFLPISILVHVCMRCMVDVDIVLRYQ